MPHYEASDLGLHCLPMSLLWDTRHKWVNLSTTTTLKQPVLVSSQGWLLLGICTVMHDVQISYRKVINPRHFSQSV